MATRTWIGDTSLAFETAANWSDDTLPVNGDTIVFNSSADAHCALTNAQPSANAAHKFAEVIIENDFDQTLILGHANANLKTDKLTIKAKAKITTAPANAATKISFFGGGTSGVFVFFNHADMASSPTGMFDSATSRSNITFDFGSTDNATAVKLENGVYPNLTFVGNTNSNTTFSPTAVTAAGTNTYPTTDILNFTTDSDTSVIPATKNQADLGKVFRIHGNIYAQCADFNWGNTTLEIQPQDTDGSKVPYNGNYTSSGNFRYGTAAKIFKAKYNHLRITGLSGKYFEMDAGSILSCNKLTILPDARFYGPDTTVNKGAEIQTIEKPTVLGDWNFSQLSDGIYRSRSNPPPNQEYHNILTNNLGTANQVLAMNSGGTALEWSSTAGGGGVTVQEEGSALSTTASTLNFVGSAVTATGTGATKTITITDSDTIYTHPTGDGNLHVPATGTSNNGKVLTAGGTAGSLSWVTPNYLTLGTTSTTALAGNTAVDNVSKANLLTVLAGLDENDTLNIGDAGDDTNVVIRGNLQVDGVTTTVNSTIVNIDDSIIKLHAGHTGAVVDVDAGLEIERGDGTNKFFFWDEGNDRWTVGSETMVAGTFIGALTGNVTGDVSGNANTASVATNANNAANVTLTDNNETDETVYLVFADGATATQALETEGKLTYNPSSGLLTTTGFVGALTGNVTGNVSGTSGSTTGNAATATALATARAINGVNFDGTAAITVPAAGSTLTDTVPVGKGGTGATTLASNAVLTGNGTSAVQAESNLTYDGNTLSVKSDSSSTALTSDPILLVRPVLESSRDAALKIQGARNGNISANTAALILSNQDDHLSNANEFNHLGAIVGRVSDMTDNHGDMHFLTFSDGATANDTMTLKGDGKVGIGTTSPSATFSVANTLTYDTGVLTMDVGSSSSNDVAQVILDGHVTSGTNTISETVVKNAGDSIGNMVWGRDSANDAGFLTFGTQPTGGNITERMRITSAGNVGIGTTSPGHLLEVAGGGANGEIVVNRTSGAEILLQAQSATGVIGTSTNHDLAIKTNGSTRMQVENGGNVGIGTTSPEYKLDLAGSLRILPTISSNAGTAIRIGANGDSNDITLLRVDGSTNDNQGETNSAGHGFSMKYMGSGSGNNNRFALVMDNQGGTAVEGVSVLQDGKVGIGNSSPSDALHVRAASDHPLVLENTTNAGYVGIQFSDNSSNSYAQKGEFRFIHADGSSEGSGASFHFTTTESDLSIVGGKFISAVGSASEPGFGFSGDVDNGMFHPATNQIAFTTAGAEAVRVDASGNVGIGQTSPSSPLDVTGSIELSSNLHFNGAGGHYIKHEGGTASSDNFTFRFSDNEDVMIVRGDGRVGIGTTNPGNILDVEQSVNGDAQIRIENTNSGGNANQATVGIVADGNHLTLASYGDSHASLANYNRITTGASSAVISIDSGTVGQGILVADGGNVGIGTTSPDYALDIETDVGGHQANMRIKDTSSSNYNTWLELDGNGNTNVAFSESGTLKWYTGMEASDNRYRLYASGGGGEVFTVEHAGNVGIGTSNPDSTLHLTSGSGYLKVDTDGSNTYLKSDFNMNYYADFDGANSAAYQNHKFFTDGTNERMRIASDGKVGIGTSSPSSTLDVVAAGTTGHGLKVYRNQSSSNMDSALVYLHDDSQYADEAVIHVKQDGTGSAGIFEGGHVGIGVTAPTDTLAVRGGIKIGEFNDTDGTGYVGTAAPNSANLGTGAADPQIRVSGRSTGNPGIIQMAQFDANNFFGGTTEFVLGRLQYAMNENSQEVTTVAEIRGITSKVNDPGHFDGALTFYTSQGDASGANLTEKMIITADGDVGIGTSSPAHKLEVNGSFAATTKSFDIEHPTKEGMRLHHGSLEGPEHGVYIRGKNNSGTIHLPDYWEGLVDEDSITVQLTAIGKPQELYVRSISNGKVRIAAKSRGKHLEYFYFIQAERKDVDKMEVEYRG